MDAGGQIKWNVDYLTVGKHCAAVTKSGDVEVGSLLTVSQIEIEGRAKRYCIFLTSE